MGRVAFDLKVAVSETVGKGERFHTERGAPLPWVLASWLRRARHGFNNLSVWRPDAPYPRPVGAMPLSFGTS